MTFRELGLQAPILARLERLGYTTPTPIQTQAIPVALDGRDVLGIARTGTGKTAAFGLPLITRLLSDKRRPMARQAAGLVLAPTRELADQIAKSLISYTSALQVVLVVGGKSLGRQASRLQRGADILVATPGRLIDLMERGAVDLRATRFLVLDEADHMLDIGFIHALRRIAAALGRDRQTMMFSATMPKEMLALARDYLRDPVKVEVSPAGETAEKAEQSLYFVEHERKQALLFSLLRERDDDRALVFVRTKHGAERLKKRLETSGMAAASIHGNRSQGQRERALQDFRTGAVSVLVATDVAARGIDIPDVGCVYNYDLPNVPESYVHRIGRTARAGRSGEAIAFCAAEEMGELQAIEKLLHGRIAVADGERWAVERAPKKARHKNAGGGNGGARRAPQARRRTVRKAA